MTFDAEGVRARLAAAAPGPWFTNEPGPYIHSVWSKDRPEDVNPVNPIAKMVGPNDARLIAHAPTDLAAALDRITELEATVHRPRQAGGPMTERIVCPDCNGTGRGRGFPSKASGVWEEPLCERCDSRGNLAVTISGDSKHVYLVDDGGRIVCTFASLAEAEAVQKGGRA